MNLHRVLIGVAGAALVWTAAVAQPLQGFDTSADVPAALPVTAFYEASPKLVGAKPGDLLKAEPVAAPAGRAGMAGDVRLSHLGRSAGGRYWPDHRADR